MISMQPWVISQESLQESLLNKSGYFTLTLILYSAALTLNVSTSDNLLTATTDTPTRSDMENNSTADYLSALEKQNTIDYQQIINTAGSYIPAMCYTRTTLANGQKQNPCYVCHTQGIPPNHINDAHLQTVYDFPTEMLNNPYKNLWKSHVQATKEISDKAILTYVRQSNYLFNGQPILKKSLPHDWPGYRPDAYFHFDSEGFDHTTEGDYTLWRAFRYYPFPGMFWPTNGSTDDVMIRLDPAFSKNTTGAFDVLIYKINLAIIESLIKQKTVQLTRKIDENGYQVDLNKNGKLDKSTFIAFPPEHYVGLAKTLQQQQKLHLAPGLYPENTEFLHSVRYLDWDNKHQRITLSARMKELRYAKKYQWLNYAQLKSVAEKEFWEQQHSGNASTTTETFRGDPANGLRTDTGWIFQGFIEAKNGQLRPQTREETISCMGCHAGIGATTDATFSFKRKFSTLNTHNSWQHWNQHYLEGVSEPQLRDKNHKAIFEYGFYLKNNFSGNEFSSNDEILNRFWLKTGKPDPGQFNKLHHDISQLLLPSFARALKLNKGYKVLVDEQSYIFGKAGNIDPLKHIYHRVKPAQTTGLTPIIAN